MGNFGTGGSQYAMTFSQDTKLCSSLHENHYRLSFEAYLYHASALTQIQMDEDWEFYLALYRMRIP